MKITHNKVGQNLNLKDAGKADKAENSNAAALKNADPKTMFSEPASTVQVSDRAQDIRRAKELALAAPDIREDRVAELQKLIDQGKYKVNAKEVADKMVDEEAQWS